MKTTTIVNAISFMVIAIIAALICNPAHAQTPNVATASAVDQELTIKGKVTDEKGPLPGVNIVLKSSKIGTVTDENGEFTFPESLSSGSVLIFSFLGYDKQEIKINAKMTYINLLMSDNIIEIMGAPNTDKPYKAKRSN